MDKPSALAAMLLAATAALAGAGVVLHASGDAGEAAYRTFLAALLMGLAAVAALGYVLLRPRQAPPSPPS